MESQSQKILGLQIANSQMPHLRKVHNFNKFCKPTYSQISWTYLWTALLCKFATSVVDTGANLPQVLLIPVQICHRCRQHWLQISHLCRWYQGCTLTCEYPWAEFFEKVLNYPNLIFRGLGKEDSWEKPEAKISWHCPFKAKYQHT